MGNAGGGKPWKQSDAAESRIGGGTITVASLSPQASTGRRTVERLAHQMPDALKYRVGPQPGLPFKCLTQRSTERTPARGAPLCA